MDTAIILVWLVLECYSKHDLLLFVGGTELYNLLVIGGQLRVQRREGGAKKVNHNARVITVSLTLIRRFR